MAKPKREKWCPDLWKKICFSSETESIENSDTGPTERHQYIDYEDPEDGYHVRGIGPVTWEVTNPECDAY